MSTPPSLLPNATERRRRALVSAGCFLACHVAYSMLQLVSVLTDIAPTFVDRAVLRVSTGFNFALDVALVLYLGVNAWSARRGASPGLLFHASTLAISLVTLGVWCVQLHFGGSQSSHVLSLVLGTLAVVSWFLPARSVVGLILAATLGIATVVGLENVGALPYAPILTPMRDDLAIYHDPRVLIMNGAIYLCAVGVPLWIALEMQRSLRQSQRLLEASFRRMQEEIAEREAAQTTLRRSVEELSAANEGLRTFFQFAAHDLRSPLTAITGFASLLDGKGTDEDSHRHAVRILAGAQHMGRLLEDLTSLVAGSAADVHLEPVRLADHVDAAQSLLEEPLRQAGGRVERADLPVVLADRHLLDRVLQNLLSNAIKFRAADRPLVIRIEAGLDGDRWVVAVRDNGIGFDAADAERVFQPFERLGQRGRHVGHGLGLAICRAAVQAMGGHISVEPVPGVGSTFRFTLGRPGVGPA